MHAFTKKWQEEGKLQLVGITQEQHPDRCRLFAQWKELDWPILWDPFNLTETSVVPRMILIDQHGIVRALRVKRRTMEASFLDAKFQRPPDLPEATPHKPEGLIEPGEMLSVTEADYRDALSDLLWLRPNRIDHALAAIEKYRTEHPDDLRALFHTGVAYRMRHDSVLRRRGDFQKALNAWTSAHRGAPNQYIWRRRVQQYGPRLDKPYPFYDWVEKAQEEVRARGKQPEALVATLTEAELALPAREMATAAGAEEPDPKGKITRGADWVHVDSAYAFVTGKKSSIARIHLVFKPNESRKVYWNNEAERMLVWLDDRGLPEGVRLERREMKSAPPPTDASREERRFEWEVVLPEALEGAVKLKGYALFNACEGETGKCVYLRRDFEIDLERSR